MDSEVSESPVTTCYGTHLDGKQQRFAGGGTKGQVNVEGGKRGESLFHAVNSQAVTARISERLKGAADEAGFRVPGDLIELRRGGNDGGTAPPEIRREGEERFGILARRAVAKREPRN
jgi:hypothetical protein